MTLFLAPFLVGMESGGSTASEGTYWAPYWIGGTALVILFAAMVALLIFGKGREHS